MRLEGFSDLEPGGMGWSASSGGGVPRGVSLRAVSTTLTSVFVSLELPSFLRIPGSKRGHGLRATRYSSTSLRLFPEESERRRSTFSFPRCGASAPATERLIRFWAREERTSGNLRATLATWRRK